MSRIVRVRIVKDSHTHEGKPCMIGDELLVDEARARWMQEQGVAEPAKSAKVTTLNEEDSK